MAAKGRCVTYLEPGHEAWAPGSGLTSTVSGLMSTVSGTLGFMAHLTQAGQGEDGQVPSLHQLCEATLSAQDLGGHRGTLKEE